MINWLIQSQYAHPDLRRGIPPAGLLSEAEHVRYEALKTPKRRADWLLGRWTAKRLLQSVVRSSLGDEMPLEALIIAKDDDGAPILPDFPGWRLSISHAGAYAFCALSVSGGAVGADIERVEARSAAFLEDYFTPPEICAVRAAPPVARDRIITTLWSAKEATLKALRLGLRVDTRALTCKLEESAHQVWNPFVIDLDSRYLAGMPLCWRGWWRALGGFVLTLTAEANEQEALPRVKGSQ